MIRLRRATTADADALGQVHVQAWREAYPGMVPDVVLSQLDPTVRAAMWRNRIERRTTTVELAEQDDAIIGFASGGPRSDATLPYAGEMAALSRDLTAEGHSSALLWVLEANVAARGFYESLGGLPIARREQQHNGFIAVEIAYGWPDLQTLV